MIVGVMIATKTMNASQNQAEKKSRISKIREIVLEDLQRIQHTTSPYVMLNSSEQDALEVIEQRFEKYERFYRPENFQRLGDIDLTRKALDIRVRIGQAIEEVRILSHQRPTLETLSVASHAEVSSASAVSDDDCAMGDIYFRDAMAFIQLGDLNEAYNLLERSIDHDDQRGISHAYLGYMTFKRRAYIADAIDVARDLLDRAAHLDRGDCDVFVLRGRFFARMGELNELERVIEHIETLDPTHPTLDRLQRKARQLRG